METMDGKTCARLKLAFEYAYTKGEVATLKKVLPILLHIVYTEGCTYGFDKEIDEFEEQYEELFGEPFKLTE